MEEEGPGSRFSGGGRGRVKGESGLVPGSSSLDYASIWQIHSGRGKERASSH